MRKVALALAIGLAFAGSAVATADAQTTRGANNIATEARILPGGLPRMGPLLSAGIRARVRPLSLLVSSLLVMEIARARSSRAASPFL